MKENYQKKMEEIIAKNVEEKKTPTLLLQACCAPCSSAVLERISEFFEITILYYNPNISDKEEYQKRLTEIKKFVKKVNTKHKISVREGYYNPTDFFDIVRGYEHLKEGSERCFRCYRLRLEETAKMASKESFDYFGTTLSISPHKNSRVLNEIGEELEEKYNVSYLFADFKKKNGYKRSIELSKEYGLYRQDYCGCVYSKLEREQEKKDKKQSS
ncbi:MAG: epoxyqueuosine reductase QueH [Bacilli bacterium]|nr:epoxyqueuosine reductase QueH [Bacilli bacterium]